MNPDLDPDLACQWRMQFFIHAARHSRRRRDFRVIKMQTTPDDAGRPVSPHSRKYSRPTQKAELPRRAKAKYSNSTKTAMKRSDRRFDKPSTFSRIIMNWIIKSQSYTTMMMIQNKLVSVNESNRVYTKSQSD